MSDVEEKTVYQKEMYAIRDIKSNIFTAPFVAGTGDEARRIFGDMCYFGGDNLIARHPEDYQLYHLGYYNISTGIVSAIESLPIFVIGASEIINMYKERYSKQIVDAVELSESV